MQSNRALGLLVFVLWACDAPGEVDAGLEDSGSADADAGPLDAGPLDAGPLDAGSLDAGPPGGDAGPPPGCSESNRADCAPSFVLHPTAVVEGYTVVHEARTRQNRILVRFPTDVTGPLPVVVWSHAGSLDDGGHRTSRDWGNAVAAAGFAVIHIEHTSATGEQARALCVEIGVPADECTAPVGEDVPGYNPGHALKAYDVSALLDESAEITAWFELETGHTLDFDVVAAGGWSGGSQPCLTLLGARRRVTATVNRFAASDARVQVCVAVSPQAPPRSGFFDEDTDSYATIERPVLVLTGANDLKDANDKTGPERRIGFDLMPADGHHHLFYSTLPEDVGDHGSYNLGTADSSDERLVHHGEALIAAARSFLRARLLDDDSARAWLGRDDVITLAGGAASWEAR